MAPPVFLRKLMLLISKNKNVTSIDITLALFNLSRFVLRQHYLLLGTVVVTIIHDDGAPNALYKLQEYCGKLPTSFLTQHPFYLFYSSLSKSINISIYST